MSAVIKLTNTSYLKVLEELLYSKVHPFDSKIPLVKLPFSNFINLLVTIFSQYAQQGTITNLNLFILNYFVRIILISKRPTKAPMKCIDICMD